MNRKYYPLWYRLGKREGYLLWFGGELDGVVTDSDRGVPSFDDLDALRTYATSRDLVVEDEEPGMFDLDSAAQWISNGTAASIGCDALLSAWNLFDDISRSVGAQFDADRERSDGLYKRLFAGSDVANEVLRPPDEPLFAPRFTLPETEEMRQILQAGLAIFQRAVRTRSDG